ncbi:MAG: hypothetical protein U1F71_10995 [Verrucomicrobiaceae bacterium]
MLREANRPGFVEVAVEYYNAAEQAAFLAGRYPARIANIVGRRALIPISEFLTYSLFYLKQHQSRTHPDIAAIARRVDRADTELSEWVQWDGNSLRVHDQCDSLDTSITRRLGDAVGLAVANDIHGLNDADWDFIEERAGVKTLDWHIASDGNQHIEVEAKGRVIADASMLTGLKGAYDSIKEKKAAAQQPGYHRAPALRYGTILAIDQKPASTMYCRLVDPDGSPTKRDPKATRLINRLTWAINIVAIISRRSSFTVALNNRLAALEKLDDPFVLSGVPLLKGDGTKMDLDPKRETSYSPFFQYRSTVDGQPYGGVVTKFDKDHLLFLGLHEDWLSALGNQDFTKVLLMSFKPGTMQTKVHCVMSRRQFKQAELKDRIDVSEEESQSVSFRLPSVIHTSAAGMAFGLVNLPPQSSP